jgi:hypothetical protein
MKSLDPQTTTKGGIQLSDWARDEIYRLRAEIVAKADSRYDNQFIKLLNILMEPPCQTKQ